MAIVTKYGTGYKDPSSLKAIEGIQRGAEVRLIKSLAAIAHGFGDNLLTRAADVMLKERRRLVLMVRETPFNLAHLRNMTAVTEMGGVVFPPLPAFYNKPQTIAEIVDDTVERVIEMLGVAGATPKRWDGL